MQITIDLLSAEPTPSNGRIIDRTVLDNPSVERFRCELQAIAAFWVGSYTLRVTTWDGQNAETYTAPNTFAGVCQRLTNGATRILAGATTIVSEIIADITRAN